MWDTVYGKVTDQFYPRNLLDGRAYVVARDGKSSLLFSPGRNGIKSLEETLNTYK